MRFTVIAILFAAPLVHAGYETGNGGDAFAIEFEMTARDLAQRLRKVTQDSVDVDKWEGAILATEVHSEDHLYLNGSEVDAINYPAIKRIELNRSRWTPIRDAAGTRARFTLVLHEYLGIMGVDDSQYRVSSGALKLLPNLDYDSSHWWNPANPVNAVKLRMISTGLTCEIQGAQFDPDKSTETVEVSSTGDCAIGTRKVSVQKTIKYFSGVQGQGTFHHYAIKVTDDNSQTVGLLDYEPQWGRCLTAGVESCQLSGAIQAGGVELIFFYGR
ncbi:MAG: hypothetical protein ACXVA9_08530 [Bdellovibrionales bacterium]